MSILANSCTPKRKNQMKKPPIIWVNVIIFTLTFAVAAIAVPLYAIFVGFDAIQIIATILALGFCGISITAGYHRLWAHKSYEAHAIVRFFYAIGGAFALQNSALHWSADHRIHHRHVDDNEKDPYSAKKGFWYSHIGWMLREYQAHRYGDYSNCRDLQKDKIVMWQHKHYLVLAALTNFGIPLALGLMHGDVWGMLLSVGVLRLVISHHTTFFINSLAHIWGRQPYTDSNTARDNDLLAFFTYGEGYHNYHHIFETDYRNGIRWWHYDPTKWLIRSLSFVGLTAKLKRCPEDKIEKAKLQMQLKKTQLKVSKLPDAEQILKQLQQEYEVLQEKMTTYYASRKRLLDLKKRKMLKQYEKSELSQQVKELKLRLEQQKRQWQGLTASFA